MLNPRKLLTELYAQKIGGLDVKSFIKKFPSHPLARTIAAIIADAGATFAGNNIMTQFNDTLYQGQGPLYSERNELARNLMEQEGLVKGILKHETERTVPTMAAYTGISGGADIGLKKVCDHMDNPTAEGFGEILGRGYLPSMALDMLNLHKFATALRIYWEFIATSNLPNREIVATVGAAGLALPYFCSLGKYYGDKIKRDFKFDAVKELSYAGKKLLDGYVKVAKGLEKKILDVKARKR